MYIYKFYSCMCINLSDASMLFWCCMCSLNLFLCGKSPFTTRVAILWFWCSFYYNNYVYCLTPYEDKIKPPKELNDDVKLQDNVLYEYRKPMQTQCNTAYDTVNPNINWHGIHVIQWVIYFMCVIQTFPIICALLIPVATRGPNIIHPTAPAWTT